MQNIESRQNAIKEIIGSQQIKSQGELIEQIRLRGIEATQATLSRDLKALQITKIKGEGYMLPAAVRQNNANTLSSGIKSIEFSGQIGLISTQIGLAPALAYVLDHHPSEPLMGTIAGDDTILLVLRQGFSPAQTLDALSAVFPGIKDRVIQK
ncbi:MAG: ArgR family transcriptional regulator [Bacteroidales bacterium]|nr:ArgR family transcriptional regulator [Bacteroidales bacterium]